MSTAEGEAAVAAGLPGSSTPLHHDAAQWAIKYTHQHNGVWHVVSPLIPYPPQKPHLGTQQVRAGGVSLQTDDNVDTVVVKETKFYALESLSVPNDDMT